MRCYFMRNGHIEGYAPLRDGPDEALIEQGISEFFKANRGRFDGFEVWRRERCLYRSAPKVPDISPSSPASAAGDSSPDTLLPRH